MLATEVGNGIGQQSTKSTCDDGAAEEEGHALLVLVSLIILRCNVDDAREEAGFENTEEESKTKEGTVGVDESHAHIDNTPAKHQRRQVQGRPESFDEHVGGYFQENVGDVVDLYESQLLE